MPILIHPVPHTSLPSELQTPSIIDVWLSGYWPAVYRFVLVKCQWITWVPATSLLLAL